MNKAVFFDRDGTLNRERGEYTFRIADFDILPGVISVLTEIKKRGYKVIVITNQGGIARGLYSPRDVDAVHDHFRDRVRDAGGDIDAFYYSPNHDTVSRSLDRKPETLLFEKAIYEHDICARNSFMIGDSDRDIIPARKLGIEAFLIEPDAPVNFILDRAQ